MESESQEGSEKGSAGGAEPQDTQETQEGSVKDAEQDEAKEGSTGGGSAEPKGSQEGSAGGEDKKADEKGEGEDEKEKEAGEYDDEPDESLNERLWGLTEMFPESVRNTTGMVVDHTIAGIKGFYCFSRTALWVIFSSSIILFAPVMFEVERAQLEEMQRTQQKQMLLGPTSTVAGNTTGVPILPPLHR